MLSNREEDIITAALNSMMGAAETTEQQVDAYKTEAITAAIMGAGQLIRRGLFEVADAIRDSALDKDS